VGTGIEQLAPAALYWRAALAWSALEQVSNEVPFGVGQIGAVKGNVFAPVRRRIAVTPVFFIGRCRHPPLRLEPKNSFRTNVCLIVALQIFTPQRRSNSSAISSSSLARVLPRFRAKLIYAQVSMMTDDHQDGPELETGSLFHCHNVPLHIWNSKP
jgi:hypothetical protein